jgi:hypothetical protein
MPGELSNTRALGPFKKETIGKPAMEAFVAGEPATLAGVASGGVDGFRYDPSWMSMRRVGGAGGRPLHLGLSRFIVASLASGSISTTRDRCGDGFGPHEPRVWRVSICSMSSR